MCEPLGDGWGNDGVGGWKCADGVGHPDECGVQRGARRAGFEVCLDDPSGVGRQGAVEVVRDVLAGVPTAHGHSFESVAALGAGGE